MDDSDLSSRLNVWFREAKQSLSIAGPICTEANELVLTSRKQIEVATVMWSRVMFIHRAVTDQFELLNRIKTSFKTLEGTCIKDFQTSLEELDGLEEKLDFTLNHLDSTLLDEAFRKGERGGGALGAGLGIGSGSGSGSGGGSGSGSGSGSKNLFVTPPPPTLRSFVHDDGVDKLRKAVSVSVEKTQKVVQDVAQIITSLEADITKFHKDMFSVQTMKRRGLETAHENTVNVATDAHAMALLLESLTRHYDLCLKAIEMSKTPDQYTDDLPEIVKILENDSQELEAVVEELYERRKFIEASEGSVSAFYKQMNDVNVKVQTFFSDLLVFGVSKLTGYSEKFEETTKLYHLAMQEILRLKQEMQSLVDYYGLFYESYRSLIVEVLRRKKTQERMEATIGDLMKTIHDSYKEEVRNRQEFVRQYGDYLPNDLWDGLLKFPIEPQVIFEKENIPEMNETSIADATRRIQL